MKSKVLHEQEDCSIYRNFNTKANAIAFRNDMQSDFFYAAVCNFKGYVRISAERDAT